MTFQGRPILGAISGFFLGFWLAIVLMSFSISPLTNFTAIGLPLLGLVLGLVIAYFAPFGGGKAKGTADDDG